MELLELLKRTGKIESAASGRVVFLSLNVRSRPDFKENGVNLDNRGSRHYLFRSEFVLFTKIPKMNAPIIVPTDFQEAAARALSQAVALAATLGRPIVLLHIASDASKVASAEDKAKALCAEVRQSHAIDIEYAVEVGNLEDDLRECVASKGAQLMVIGSYGIRGLAQHIFGARILHVLRDVGVPAVVVQGSTPVKQQFKKILLPVDDIAPFDLKVNTVIAFAKKFDSEVMLYALRHPMTDQKKVVAHVNIARKLLADSGIKYNETEESPTVFSSGIAKQTLIFAEDWGADLIAISMAEPESNAKLNQAECEQVINNKSHIAVLCTPERQSNQKIFS